MGKYTEWITHKGVRILLATYANILDEEEYLRAIEETEQQILSQPKGKHVPTIIDVTNTRLSSVVTERAKQMTARAGEAGIPESPTVMVGLSGIQKAVILAMQFFRRDLHMAESIEKAKEWLVKQIESE